MSALNDLTQQAEVSISSYQQDLMIIFPDEANTGRLESGISKSFASFDQGTVVIGGKKMFLLFSSLRKL